jgi:hypothetical protein
MMMQPTTPENPDAIATTNPPASSERRFEAVVNFADADGVGECLLALNRKGLVYTNNAEPIEEWEHVVSGTVTGTVELAAGEDEDKVVVDKAFVDKAFVDKAFDLVGRLIEPLGGECIECRFVDRQATPPF